MKSIALLILLILCGCPAEPTMKMETSLPEVQDGRFKVTRVGIFEDGLAYGNRRGVYLIIDRETGKEFVGVSGIGISELGRHSTGKASASDER